MATHLLKNNLMSFVEDIRPTYDHVEDIVFIKDLDFRYVYVNPQFLKYAPPRQTSLSGFIGFRDTQLYSKEIASDYEKRDRMVKENQKTITYDLVVVYGDGEKYFNLSKSPIYDKKGTLIGILAIARDITSYVTLRKQHEENFNLINTIIDTVQFPIFVKDLDFNFKLVNSAFANLHGLTKEDVLGKSDFDLFDEKLAKKFLEKDKRILHNGEKEIYLFQDPDYLQDLRFQSSVTINEPLKNSNGEITGLLGVVNTIFDLEEVQDYVMQEEKMKSLISIAGGIAHDLNNILLNVVGLSSFLVEKYTDPDLQEKLTTIENAGLQASNLIKQLLTFAKSTPGKDEDVILDEIMQHVISLLKVKCEDRVEIDYIYEGSKNVVKGDKDQLTQVFLNLLINANEAIINTGKINIEISEIQYHNIKTTNTLLPSNPQQSDYFRIIIQDNGKGIDKSEIGRIFEPYFTTKGEENSGLGLSIVYSVISKHGGFIDVQPLGKGTKFTIFLPASTKTAKRTEIREEVKINQSIDIKSVMIVDDNSDILPLFEAFLEIDGIETHLFDNPYEAVEKYRILQSEVSTVILDIKMPQMSGDQVLKQLREINPDVKVLISSGFSEDHQLEAVKTLGVNGFLPKPFKRKDLINKLKEVIV